MSSPVQSNNANSDSFFYVPDDRLYLATRAFLIFLQGLFKDRPAGQFRWSENPDETEILITDQLPENGQAVGKRPIIVTTRGAARYRNVSLDHVMERDMSGDALVYSDIIETDMTFTCIAREGVEAQNLAFTIFRMVPIFKGAIGRLGDMHWIGANMQIGPESQGNQIIPGSGFSEWKIVQVSVPFAIQDTVSVKSDFHTLLRAVNLHMEQKNGA